MGVSPDGVWRLIVWSQRRPLDETRRVHLDLTVAHKYLEAVEAADARSEDTVAVEVICL